MIYCIHCKKLIKGSPSDQSIIDFYRNDKDFLKLVPGFASVCKDCLYDLSENELALAIIGLRDYFLATIKEPPHTCLTCGVIADRFTRNCEYEYNCKVKCPYVSTSRWTINWNYIAQHVYCFPVELANDGIMAKIWEKIIPFGEWTIHNKQEIIKNVHRYYNEYKEVSNRKL